MDGGSGGVSRIALVTGAGRGIGEAIARAFAAEGDSVVCVARTASEVEAVASSIGGVAVAGDVTIPADVDRAVAACQALGGLDVLVLNAGVNPAMGPVDAVDPDAWWSTFDVNVRGAYLCARAAVPLLRARGGGKILVVGSGPRHRAGPGWSAYAASKAALWSFTRVLAQELRADHIAVNEIIPGPVRTALAASSGAAVTAPPVGIATEWFKEPADVASLALYLAALPDDGPTAQSFSLLGRDA